MTIQQHMSARLTLHAQPNQVSGAQATFYDLTIENLSGEDWNPGDPHPVSLSYHWLNERGDPVIYDGIRTPLPGALRAGRSCRAIVRIHPPALPGRYILAIDLVREGVSWFDLDCRSYVDLPPVTQPRAVLINRNCIARDAIGNNILRKLRLLRKWGYAPLLLVNDFDRRLPAAEQALMVEIDLAHILDPSPSLQWAAQHFWHAGLHIFDYPEYYPLLDLIHMAPRGAVIFDYHGVTPPALWTSALSRENIELGVKNLSLVANADLAIAHSEYTRAELLATGLIAPDRVALMPYAVATDIFHPALHKPAAHRREPGDGPTLLYVGRMASNKRIDTLIRMAALVKEQHPHIRLLLVGDDQSPAYREVIDAARVLIGALDLADNIVFAGQVPDDQLVAYYQSADVFVTASQHEGFCIPVIEAMACGMPVVAARATALPWTVGDAGLLFEPEDVQMFAAQVLKLLHDQT